jgi:sterol 24-C-methyltransferase
MYMPPVYDDKQDVYENQKIYERKMAHHLQVGPGSKVLDIGCGRGRVAHHVATYTGAHVTGLNIDPEQIKMAKEYAIYTGTQDRLDFILADYNHRLPFDDASLDAVYYVQVLSYHANITKFFEEVKRVLKPNGRVAFEDYVLGVNYDATNPAHVHLKNAYKPVVGGVETSFPWVFKAAVEAAGFVVTYHQDDSLGGWQYPLLEKERDFWVPLSKTVEFLYGYGIVPKIYYDVMERMTRGTDSLIEADKQKLISMGTVTFAHKPAP